MEPKIFKPSIAAQIGRTPEDRALEKLSLDVDSGSKKVLTQARNLLKEAEELLEEITQINTKKAE
jgi:hypothetical protein